MHLLTYCICCILMKHFPYPWNSSIVYIRRMCNRILSCQCLLVATQTHIATQYKQAQLHTRTLLYYWRSYAGSYFTKPFKYFESFTRMFNQKAICEGSRANGLLLKNICCSSINYFGLEMDEIFKQMLDLLKACFDI